MKVRLDDENRVSKSYLVNFASGMFKAYLAAWNFVSMDVQIVSRVYLASFYPFMGNPYLLMFK